MLDGSYYNLIILLGFQGATSQSSNLTFNFADLQFFEILSIQKPSPDHVSSHTLFGPDRFSRLYVYRLQIDKQSI